MVKDQQQLVSRKVEEGEAVLEQLEPVCNQSRSAANEVLWWAALLFRLKQKAMTDCKDVAKAYADCCSARMISAVWACRSELGMLNQCLQRQCAPAECCVSSLLVHFLGIVHCRLTRFCARFLVSA